MLLNILIFRVQLLLFRFMGERRYECVCVLCLGVNAFCTPNKFMVIRLWPSVSILLMAFRLCPKHKLRQTVVWELHTNIPKTFVSILMPNFSFQICTHRRKLKSLLLFFRQNQNWEFSLVVCPLLQFACVTIGMARSCWNFFWKVMDSRQTHYL